MKKANLLDRISIMISAILMIVAGFVAHASAAAVHPVLGSGTESGAFGNDAVSELDTAISPDGRYLVFTSKAGNLISALTDNNGTYDIFVRDLQTGTLRCLTRNFTGMETGNAASSKPRISDNGRYVVFESMASNLTDNDSNAFQDIFRYDLQTDDLAVVSMNASGTLLGNNTSLNPEISADGRFVVFGSQATNLFPGFVDGNTAANYDVFMRDMQTGTVRLISAAAGSPTTGGNGIIITSSNAGFNNNIIAANRYVIFSSTGTNFVSGLNDTNTSGDVFVRDIQTDTTVCVSVTAAGNTTGNGVSYEATISQDGRRIFFRSQAYNLGPNDTNGFLTDLLMRDMQSGVTQLVSVNYNGTGSGNNESAPGFGPLSITPNGRFVAFTSLATNLVTGFNYTAGTQNVFIRDIETGVTRLVSVDKTGTEAGNGQSVLSRSGITADGRFVGFSSNSTNLVSEDSNTSYDVYVRDTKARLTILLSWNNAGTNGGNNASSFPFIAANARRAAFGSKATDLMSSFNNASEVYYADFFAGQRPVADFDGDGKSDYSVYRPQLNSPWYVFQSTNNLATYRYWGADTDLIAPADYNGDDFTDYAVFRPSNGTWYISDGATFATREIRFGLAGDKPVPADYDGDGKADVAVFRPSNGLWYILRSSDNQVSFVQFGLASDIPLIGDFDGDTKADVAVFRPSTGVWHILRSRDGSYTSVQFGLNGDKPIPQDYDGDGKTDIAVFRNGVWYVLRSSNNQVSIINWGLSGDVPVPGDYDGDGRPDVAVFRPSEGNWYVLRSSNNTPQYIHFGQNGDLPAPAAFVP